LRTYSFALIVTIYFSKLFVVVFLLVDDVLRLFRWTGTFVSNTFFSAEKRTGGIHISRFEFLSKLGFIVGSIPFASMIYGMLGGAYRYQVRKVKIASGNLPPLSME
jgi:hypothetical protein